MSCEIVLPAGMEFVNTSGVPHLIARALRPQVTGTRQVALLTKTAKSGDEEGPIEDIDQAILNEIWRDLPPLVLPISEDNWRPYADAFAAAAGGRAFDWELNWYCSEPALRNDVELERKHLEKLIDEIRAKRLCVHNGETRIETDVHDLDSMVTVEDLTRYVAAFNISVRVGSECPNLPTEVATVGTSSGVLSKDELTECAEVTARAPAPLSKKAILASGWPTTVNLDRLLSDVPVWLEDAFSGEVLVRHRAYGIQRCLPFALLQRKA